MSCLVTFDQVKLEGNTTERSDCLWGDKYTIEIDYFVFYT